MDEAIKFFLMVIAGCGAIFVSVLTFFTLYAFIPFLYDIVRNVWRYAGGKFKDNEL